jgi:hypothetical protein
MTWPRFPRRETAQDRATTSRTDQAASASSSRDPRHQAATRMQLGGDDIEEISGDRWRPAPWQAPAAHRYS